MLIRHAADGNLYLYDMVNIKKETNIFWKSEKRVAINSLV